eukprot:UN17956
MFFFDDWCLNSMIIVLFKNWRLCAKCFVLFKNYCLYSRIGVFIQMGGTSRGGIMFNNKFASYRNCNANVLTLHV